MQHFLDAKFQIFFHKNNNNNNKQTNRGDRLKNPFTVMFPTVQLGMLRMKILTKLVLLVRPGGGGGAYCYGRKNFWNNQGSNYF